MVMVRVRAKVGKSRFYVGLVWYNEQNNLEYMSRMFMFVWYKGKELMVQSQKRVSFCYGLFGMRSRVEEAGTEIRVRPRWSCLVKEIKFKLEVEKNLVCLIFSFFWRGRSREEKKARDGRHRAFI